MKRKASNIEVKKYNKDNIYRYIIHKNTVSRPDIVEEVKLSMPTVLQIVNELIEQGLVKEVGEFKSTGGRKAIAISLVKNSKIAMGIDITSKHVSLVLTNIAGDILSNTRCELVFKDNEDYYISLVNLILKYKKKWIKDETNFLGFGFSIPGIIDEDQNKITYSHILNIRNISFDVFKRDIKEKTIFINDANAAAVTEIYGDRDNKDFIYLSLSNSVGGAIIRNTGNKSIITQSVKELIYLGDNMRSGEFGHMLIKCGGEKCYCGRHGCLDAYCSARKLSMDTGYSVENFFKKLNENDEKCIKYWDEYTNYLAEGIASLRMIFDCNIIIGGYIGSYIEDKLEDVKRKVESLNIFEKDSSFISKCNYKVESSAFGAALTLIDDFISTI